MITQYKISRFLNKELKIKSISDRSRNGLQANNVKYIKKVGVAVDASLETFKKAKSKNCDLVIVHHGMFWKGKKGETGLLKQKVNFLKKAKMNVYAAHLPLDLHPKYGNNIILAGLLELQNIKKYGDYHGMMIGYQGKLKRSLTINKLSNLLAEKINCKPMVMGYGKKSIKKVGIISGGPVEVDYAMKVDCLITGEGAHSRYVDAKDLKLNIIYGGHYETETVGVRAIGKLLKERFNLEYEYVRR